VQFDIAGDGQQRLLGWTEAGTRQAFLWLDRNHNGVVDDGTELFGNHTPLRSGDTATDGFQALADYDENADGVIDQQDSVWSDLKLWFDFNHDGVSQPSEIQALSQSEVESIDLHYVLSGRRDRFGNTFRFRSAIGVQLPNGRIVSRPCYDIFFVIAQP
jgi:hypothetical protein